MGCGPSRVPAPFQIQVKGVAGSTTCIMIFGTDRVAEIARQVAEATSLPARGIRLQWGRHVLDERRPIHTYDIHRDAVIFAILRIGGACGHRNPKGARGGRAGRDNEDGNRGSGASSSRDGWRSEQQYEGGNWQSGTRRATGGWVANPPAVDMGDLSEAGPPSSRLR